MASIRAAVSRRPIFAPTGFAAGSYRWPRFALRSAGGLFAQGKFGASATNLSSGKPARAEPIPPATNLSSGKPARAEPIRPARDSRAGSVNAGACIRMKDSSARQPGGTRAFVEPPAVRRAHRAKRMCDCRERGTSGVLVLGSLSDENSGDGTD